MQKKQEKQGLVKTSASLKDLALLELQNLGLHNTVSWLQDFGAEVKLNPVGQKMSEKQKKAQK